MLVPEHASCEELRIFSLCAQSSDLAVDARSAQKLTSFDKALKSFKYHEAFDAALQDGSPEVVVSVVEELVQRNGLRIALQGRNQQTLQPVVAFLARQITSAPFSEVLIGVANLLLDMYAPVFGHSAAIDELFVKLRNVLEGEVRLQVSPSDNAFCIQQISQSCLQQLTCSMCWAGGACSTHGRNGCTARGCSTLQSK